MIRKLRFRMTLLVICVLVAVSAGIVLAIYEMNTRNIYAQVESALDALSETGGAWPEGIGAPPDGRIEPPEYADGRTAVPPGDSAERSETSGDSEERGAVSSVDSDERSALAPGNSDHRPSGLPEDPGAGGPGRRVRNGRLSGAEVARLSNYYTATLDDSGQVQSWSSERKDLYDDAYIQSFADQVLALGQASGRVDTQFFRLSDAEDGRLLIVLDARLELAAGERVLLTTLLVAGIACLLLSLGAWLLIRRMVQPVAEAFDRQQQFVWDASHELKTPLAVIQANADVLENEIGQNENLGYIRSEVRRADDLVKNLLTLARMDRGTVRPDLLPLDWTDTVLSVLLPFETSVYEAGKTMETDLAEQVYVTGDAAMLQQLTVILLSNALKYSDAHGVIRVRLSRKGRNAELRVENTGEGISPGDLPRIFDRFYRTDRSRNSETGGEGLGLAIAQSIVEAHHGKITAESTPGQLTSFIVTLAAAARPEA